MWVSPKINQVQENLTLIPNQSKSCATKQGKSKSSRCWKAVHSKELATNFGIQEIRNQKGHYLPPASTGGPTSIPGSIESRRSGLSNKGFIKNGDRELINSRTVFTIEPATKLAFWTRGLQGLLDCAVFLQSPTSFDVYTFSLWSNRMQLHME